MLTAPDLTLLFLGVVVGLGIAFVWMIWEAEQMIQAASQQQPLRVGDAIASLQKAVANAAGLRARSEQPSTLYFVFPEPCLHLIPRVLGGFPAVAP